MPVPPLPSLRRCSVPSRSFLLAPAALRGGLHPDRPCAPARLAAIGGTGHTEHRGDQPDLRGNPASTKPGAVQVAATTTSPIQPNCGTGGSEALNQLSVGT